MTNLTDGSLHLCRCFEIPFANAQGIEVNPDSCREFGRGVATALAAWFIVGLCGSGCATL